MQQMIDDEQYNNFIQEIGETFLQLQDMAYQQYKLIAYSLCSRNADEKEVAYVLDRLVSFCDSEKNLALFKMICRRYLALYPDLIEYEIQTYREMFDSDQENN